MGVGLEQRAEQRMLPSARLVAWVELLALPAERLDDYVTAQLARNPALDLPVGRTCGRCGGTVWNATAHACLSRRAAVDPADLAARTHAHDLLGEDRRIADYLRADADARGRIDRPLADVADALGTSAAEVARVLDLLRESAPGFGARDVKEALLLQLRARPDAPPAAYEAVLHLGEEGYEEGLAWVAANLDPGAAIDDGSAAPYDRPDLVVDDALTVRVVDAAWLALRVAPSYQRHAAADASVAQAAREAKTVVDRLATRGKALTRVAQAAVDRQEAWVRGTGPRSTVTQASVAAELGLHESTVSRAVGDKRLLLAGGRVVALRELFGRHAARDVLRDLIANDTERRSDAALAAALTAMGLPSARRTVAKYRAQLGIPSSR